MARRTTRPQPTRHLELPASIRICPECGGPLWAAYRSRRTVTTLDGVVRLGIQVRRCRDRQCRRLGVPLRSEQEGRLVLPQHEFGLDVVALIGRPSTAASPRSMPNWSDAAYPSAPAASATCWIATTNCWPCRPRTSADCGGSPPSPGG